MTKHAESATQEETGRRLTDVEITPAMIEAGADALCLWEPDDSPSLVVQSVFAAMLTAAQT
jgi:hypothetical protein